MSLPNISEACKGMRIYLTSIVIPEFLPIWNRWSITNYGKIKSQIFLHLLAFMDNMAWNYCTVSMQQWVAMVQCILVEQWCGVPRHLHYLQLRKWKITFIHPFLRYRPKCTVCILILRFRGSLTMVATPEPRLNLWMIRLFLTPKAKKSSPVIPFG